LNEYCVSETKNLKGVILDNNDEVIGISVIYCLYIIYFLKNILF